MKILNVFKKLIITTIALTVIIFGGVYLVARVPSLQPVIANTLSSFRKYPSPTEPKDITLTCNYHGKNLAVTETVYGSIDNYYRSEPKKTLSYFTDDNKAFVFSYPEDKTIDDLALKITNLGKANNLKDDQIVDLTGCLLQSIPYDTAKANKILSPNFKSFPTSELIPRYPYETLYDFTGVCTDKSYLGALVLKNMGYETSLLVFDTEKHLSLGVKVPAGFESFTNTNDGILELTGTGFLVGDIPELSSAEGLAQNTFEKISTDQKNEDSNRVKLSTPSKVIPISTGRTYTRIVDRTELRNQITELYKQIELKKADVQIAQQELSMVQTTMKEAENAYTTGYYSYSKYRLVYDSYLDTYSKAKNTVNAYNANIDRYNRLIEQYKNF